MNISRGGSKTIGEEKKNADGDKEQVSSEKKSASIVEKPQADSAEKTADQPAPTENGGQDADAVVDKDSVDSSKPTPGAVDEAGKSEKTVEASPSHTQKADEDVVKEDDDGKATAPDATGLDLLPAQSPEEKSQAA